MYVSLSAKARIQKSCFLEIKRKVKLNKTDVDCKHNFSWAMNMFMSRSMNMFNALMICYMYITYMLPTRYQVSLNTFNMVDVFYAADEGITLFL